MSSSVPEPDPETYLDIIDLLAYDRQTDALRPLLDAFITKAGQDLEKGSDLDTRLYLAGIYENANTANTSKDFQELLQAIEIRKDVWLRAYSLHDYRLFRLKLFPYLILSYLRGQLPPEVNEVSDRQMKRLSLDAYYEAIDQFLTRTDYYRTPDEEETTKDIFLAHASERERKKMMNVTNDTTGLPDKIKIAYLMWSYPLDQFRREVGAVTRQVDAKLLPPPKLKSQYDKDLPAARIIAGLRQPL